MKLENAPESTQLNFTLNRVKEILGYDNDEKVSNVSDSNTKITDILKVSKNKRNVELAAYLIGEVDSQWFKSFDIKNKEIALIGIKASSDNFKHIDKKLQKDEDIAKVLIKTYLREGADFFTIRAFILNNYDEELSKILLKEYRIHLDKYSSLVGDDLSKTLFSLEENDKKLLETLNSFKIIIKKTKKHIVNPDFLKNLNYNCLKDSSYKSLSKEEKINFKRNILVKQLGLEEVSETTEYLINLIIDLSFLEEDKIELKKKNNEDNDEKDLSNEKDDIGNNVSNTLDNSNTFETIMDYSLANYNYSSSGSYYNIHAGENIDIQISKLEKEQFTSEALENYIKFYKLFYKLGLNFFIDKYSSSFKNLLAVKSIDFDYTSGKGITESTTLKILNLIGKNIGIPEKEELVNNGDTKKVYGCFKTVSDATILFEQIKSSSIINNEYIDTNMYIGAVEKKLSFDVDSKGKSLKKKLDYASGSIISTNWI